MDHHTQDPAPAAGREPEPIAATVGAPVPGENPAWLPPQVKDVFRRLGPVGPLAVISLTLPAIGTFLVLFMLKQTDLAPWLQSRGATGIAIYVLAYLLLSGLALCNTYAPSLVGGFAFGIRTGSWAAMAAVTLAATIAYIIARQASGTRVTMVIAEQPKWKAVHDALIGGSTAKTFGIVALIRVSSSPFAMTNLILGATRVNPLVYVLGTMIGFAPRTIATVVIGSRLSSWGQIEGAGSKWLTIAFIVATFIVLGIIGAIGNQAVQKVTRG